LGEVEYWEEREERKDSEEKGSCYQNPLFVGAALEEEIWEGHMVESHVKVMAERLIYIYTGQMHAGDGCCGVLLWWDDSTIPKQGNKSISSLQAPTFLCLCKYTLSLGLTLTSHVHAHTHTPFAHSLTYLAPLSFSLVRWNAQSFNPLSSCCHINSTRLFNYTMGISIHTRINSYILITISFAIFFFLLWY